MRRSPKHVAHKPDGSGGALRKKAGGMSKDITRQLYDAELTHPDRVLYPEQGLTKLDLAAYYVQVGERMLPYIANRPLSLVPCLPRGPWRTLAFFKSTARARSRLHWQASRCRGRENRAVLCRNRLAGAAGAGPALRAGNPYLGRAADDLERPNLIVFDLDPGPGVAWRQIAAAASNSAICWPKMTSSAF